VIWDLLFDPFTSETRATIFDNLAAIIDAEPRVNLTSISIDEYDQGIAVALDLEYIATGDAKSLSLEFDRVSESIYVSGQA
jgi:phage baseplate assembly protein W